MMLIVLLSVAASAGTFEESLSQAQAAVTAGQDPSKSLTAARRAAASAPHVVDANLLARIWWLDGIGQQQQGDPDELAMQDWRRSLTIDPEFTWDESVWADDTSQDLFEALRQEVRSHTPAQVELPEKTGEARLFIDGRRARAGDLVRPGQHLAQITCPDGSTHGTWTDFHKKVRWFKMCPGGVDTTVVVAEEEPASDDEWGDLGPSFGPDPDVTEPPVVADTPPTTPAAAPVTAPVSPAQANPAPGAGEPLIEQAPPRKIRWALVGAAGGVAVAGGLVYKSALSNRQAFDDLNNPDLQTEADVRALRDRTNTQATLGTGMGVLAVGMYVAAFVQW